MQLREQIHDGPGSSLRAVDESGGARRRADRGDEPVRSSRRAADRLEDSINAPVPSGGYLVPILRFVPRRRDRGEYRADRLGRGRGGAGAELGRREVRRREPDAWLGRRLRSSAALVFLIGLVMLIVVLVRRSRSKREVRMAGIPPVAPYWGPPGARASAPGRGATPTGPPSQYPPYPPPPQQPGGPDQTATLPTTPQQPPPAPPPAAATARRPARLAPSPTPGCTSHRRPNSGRPRRGRHRRPAPPARPDPAAPLHLPSPPPSAPPPECRAPAGLGADPHREALRGPRRPDQRPSRSPTTRPGSGRRTSP